MSEIKYIYYDSQETDNVALDNRINSLCQSSYRIDANQLFVNYPGSSKDLYDNLDSIIEGKRILVFEVTTDYYGYHASSLWKWLKEQISLSTCPKKV